MSATSVRRRNGRWNEEETAFLIRHVRELGKGKWKRILEQGGTIFQNRSQVVTPFHPGPTLTPWNGATGGSTDSISVILTIRLPA